MRIEPRKNFIENYREERPALNWLSAKPRRLEEDKIASSRLRCNLKSGNKDVRQRRVFQLSS